MNQDNETVFNAIIKAASEAGLYIDANLCTIKTSHQAEKSYKIRATAETEEAARQFAAICAANGTNAETIHSTPSGRYVMETRNPTTEEK